MFCPKCGGQMNENQACPYCGYAPAAQPQTPYQNTYYNPAESAFAPKGNVLMGTVGALIGSLLGVASIVLFFQMDMVASLSGLILALCTLKGYELLGGQLSKRGIIICCLIMAITPYIADRLDWAIIIAQTFADEGVTLGAAFAAVHAVIAENDMLGDYFYSLGMVYLFVVLGAFGTLRNRFKKN